MRIEMNVRYRYRIIMLVGGMMVVAETNVMRKKIYAVVIWFN